MKPLLILLLVFIICAGISKLFSGKLKFRFPAIISVSVMFVFTAIAHFEYTEGMSRMLPDYFPFKMEIVYLTGFLEIILAVGLIFKRTRRIAAFFMILFLILILPANIYAAINQVDFTDLSVRGKGTSYLWIRIPLQFLFISWIYFAVLFTNSRQ